MHGISVGTCKNIMDLVYSNHIDLERIKMVLTIAPAKNWNEGAIYKALKENWFIEDKKSYNTRKVKAEEKAKEAIENSLKNKEQRDKAIQEREKLDKYYNTLSDIEKSFLEKEAFNIALAQYGSSVASVMARTKVKYDLLQDQIEKKKVG